MAFVVSAMTLTSCCSNGVSLSKTNATIEDSLSYAYGVGLGDNLRQNLGSMPAEIDVDLFLSALTKTMKNQDDKLQIKPEEAYQVFQRCLMAAVEKKNQENMKEGADYMAENAKKDGVVTTASGLQYEILTAAEGPKPTATDRVKVHYTGTLLDGTVFDSSVDRGTPAEFGVNQVISGWQEGLQLMNVGSKVRFVIPANSAYGDRGAGELIQPGSTLIFEVELLEILK